MKLDTPKYILRKIFTHLSISDLANLIIAFKSRKNSQLTSKKCSSDFFPLLLKTFTDRLEKQNIGQIFDFIDQNCVDYKFILNYIMPCSQMAPFHGDDAWMKSYLSNVLARIAESRHFEFFMVHFDGAMMNIMFPSSTDVFANLIELNEKFKKMAKRVTRQAKQNDTKIKLNDLLTNLAVFAQMIFVYCTSEEGYYARDEKTGQFLCPTRHFNLSFKFQKRPGKLHMRRLTLRFYGSRQLDKTWFSDELRNKYIKVFALGTDYFNEFYDTFGRPITTDPELLNINDWFQTNPRGYPTADAAQYGLIQNQLMRFTSREKPEIFKFLDVNRTEIDNFDRDIIRSYKCAATSFRDFDLGDMISWLRIRKKLSIFGLENSSLDIQDTAYGRTGGFHYPLKVLNLNFMKRVLNANPGNYKWCHISMLDTNTKISHNHPKMNQIIDFCRLLQDNVDNFEGTKIIMKPERASLIDNHEMKNKFFLRALIELDQIEHLRLDGFDYDHEILKKMGSHDANCYASICVNGYMYINRYDECDYQFEKLRKTKAMKEEEGLE